MTSTVLVGSIVLFAFGAVHEGTLLQSESKSPDEFRSDPIVDEPPVNGDNGKFDLNSFQNQKIKEGVYLAIDLNDQHKQINNEEVDFSRETDLNRLYKQTSNEGVNFNSETHLNSYYKPSKNERVNPNPGTKPNDQYTHISNEEVDVNPSANLHDYDREIGNEEFNSRQTTNMKGQYQKINDERAQISPTFKLKEHYHRINDEEVNTSPDFEKQVNKERTGMDVYNKHLGLYEHINSEEGNIHSPIDMNGRYKLVKTQSNNFNNHQHIKNGEVNISLSIDLNKRHKHPDNEKVDLNEVKDLPTANMNDQFKQNQHEGDKVPPVEVDIRFPTDTAVDPKTSKIIDTAHETEQKYEENETNDTNTDVERKFPFMASIQWNWIHSTHHICGGAIISSSFVLTVAHCKRKSGSYTVVAGISDLTKSYEGAELRNVLEYITHPDYPRQFTLENDIGLVRVNPLFSGNVKPIALPSHGEIILMDSFATLVGWGRNKIGLRSKLQSSARKFLNIKECTGTFYNALGVSTDGGNVCTASSDDTSVCLDESGTVLVQDGKLVGIVSVASSLCGSEGPTLSVQVSTFVNWIRSRVTDLPV